MIEMRDIVKVFRTGAGDFTALNGVDICFFEGEFVSVVGKSGSGKSTLVNMLTGREFAADVVDAVLSARFDAPGEPWPGWKA